jgi:secreted PhoX family phosphatase
MRAIRNAKQAKDSTAPLSVSRRGFLGSGLFTGGALLGGAVTGTTLDVLTAHSAWAAHGDRTRVGRSSDYGPLAPTPDQNGDSILALPEGFSYVTFSKTGDPLPDGARVPRNHDGMTAFQGPGNIVRLIRNHENRNAAGDAALGVIVPDARKYDVRAHGGCFTLDFDTKRKRLLRQFASIGGTHVNCAGGWSFQNQGWITCEETTAGIPQGYAQPHGYNFLVDASAQSPVQPVPLRAMGRFAHEASLADIEGIVYQTEDAGNTSGFYRFLPNNRRNLAQGGALQMLGITGNPTASFVGPQTPGLRLPVTWIDVPLADPNLEGGDPRTFTQARGLGGAAFNRLEGLFRGLDGLSTYFVSTSGGSFGQLWHYIPRESGDELVMVFQSPSGSVLDSPDNICITPNGAVIFCEDDASSDGDTHPLAPGITDVNRLVGIGSAGEPFEFAVNRLNDSEFAGAVFSPDGEVLFVNLFGDANPGSGMTCAIWGPWEKGPF